MSDQPDDSEPLPERQAELEALYAANVPAGRPPYENVTIRTLGESCWMMAERVGRLRACSEHAESARGVLPQ